MKISERRGRSSTSNRPYWMPGYCLLVVFFMVLAGYCVRNQFCSPNGVLLDANAPMEVGRRHNGNGGLLGQNQQILISCYPGISFAGNCQFDKYLVVFVAANGYFARWQNSVYDFGKGKEIAQQLFLISRIQMKFWVSQDPDDLFRGCFRDQRDWVSKAPAQCWPSSSRTSKYSVSGKWLMIALGSVIWFFEVFFASILESENKQTIKVCFE